MKRKILLPLSGLLAIVITITIACQKGTESPKEEKNESGVIVPSPKWTASDDSYVACLKKFSNSYRAKNGAAGRAETAFCVSSGEDSTYGWFSDPDSCISEGPYVRAKVGPYEENAENCADIAVLGDSATAYLTREGFTNLLPYYATKPHWRVHAANALLDIKYQCQASGPIDPLGRGTGLMHCIFQAIGATGIAAIINDYATRTTAEIIKRVSKLIAKHYGFFGAIIAIVEFVDCVLDL